jgi:hypothetical protein
VVTCWFPFDDCESLSVRNHDSSLTDERHQLTFMPGSFQLLFHLPQSLLDRRMGSVHAIVLHDSKNPFPLGGRLAVSPRERDDSCVLLPGLRVRNRLKQQLQSVYRSIPFVRSSLLSDKRQGQAESRTST